MIIFTDRLRKLESALGMCLADLPWASPEEHSNQACQYFSLPSTTCESLLCRAFDSCIFCNIRRGGLGPYIRWVRGPHQHALSVTVRRAGSGPSTVVFWRGLKPHLPPLVRKELTVACLSSLYHPCKTAPLYASITAVNCMEQRNPAQLHIFKTLQKNLSQSKYSK